MNYKEQANEIEILAKRIIKKSKVFAKQKHISPHFEDLHKVLSELKEIDSFLK